MTDQVDDPSDDVTPADLTPADRALADRLAAQRALPSPGFRGALERHLVAADPGYGTRPPRLRAQVAACLMLAAALLLVGLLCALGSL